MSFATNDAGNDSNNPTNKTPGDMSQLIIGRTFLRRSRLGQLVIVVVLVIVIVQLINVQFLQADRLREKSAQQRVVHLVIPALRGTITDSKGRVLAASESYRSLTFQPRIIEQQIRNQRKKDPSVPDVASYLQSIATFVSKVLKDNGMSNNIESKDGSVHDDYSQESIYQKLSSHDPFVYIARNVKPSIALQIQSKFPQIGAELTPIRVYPAQNIAGNLIGVTRIDGPGLGGLELSMDSYLTGTNGAITYDRSEDGQQIPGSVRSEIKPENGAQIQLTIDEDVQYFLQQALDKTVAISRARRAEAVVIDSATGKIVGLANDHTFNPAHGPQGLALGVLDPSLQLSFEPGSVNKIITASGIAQYNTNQPDDVVSVPGQIRMGGITVHDAWEHGTEKFTVRGIFAQSSNVGTLLLSQKLGRKRWYDLARAFGIGVPLDLGIGGQSQGTLLNLDQWTGSTFANAPIGQGLTMNLVQMTSMYQTIANGGVRIPPRIIESIKYDNGKEENPPEKLPVRVIDKTAASEVLHMFEAVMQKDPQGRQSGSGTSGAVPGYAISGKTGTAQQWLPKEHRYSNSDYNITFAGVLPDDHPRFVIGIMLDAPKFGSDGRTALTAAPLFKEISLWLIKKYHIAPSVQMPAQKKLVVD